MLMSLLNTLAREQDDDAATVQIVVKVGHCAELDIAKRLSCLELTPNFMVSVTETTGDHRMWIWGTTGPTLIIRRFVTYQKRLSQKATHQR